MSVQKLITEHLDLWTGATVRKSSSGRGGSSKVELAGIRKLRELILELAVRGKLVEQNPEDEPASALLSRIACERATLLEKGAIKKPRIPKGRSHRYEPPFSIPNSWKWSPLDDLAPTPLFDGDWIESKDQDPNGSIRLLQLADIGVGEFKDASDKHINVEAFKRLNCSKVLPGDVLIARLPSPIGRAAIFPGLEQECITAVDVAILRASGILNSRYVVYALNSPTSRTQVESYGKGATRFRISTGHLKTVLIPVAPLSEQHRIVQKVDELMALCDRLEQHSSDQLEAHETLVDTLLGTLTQSENAADLADNWARTATHFDALFTTEQSIDKLKQTILQLAVMGRLVGHDARHESAAKLAERIKSGKDLLVKGKEIKAQAKLKSNSHSETSHSMPRHWTRASLDELSHVQGGIQKQPKRRPLLNRHPYLRVADVQRGALMDCKELPEFELFNDELTQYRLKKGDILVVEGNGSAEEIGRCAIWDDRVPDCVYQNHLMRVRPVVPETSSYLALYLNSPPGIGEMKRLAVTSSGLYNLSVGKIRSISVPLPPLPEQISIVEKVEELTALCDQLKERLNQARETRSQLADAIVESALH